LAQPENERPKEGDFLVSIHSETPVPLQPKDIPSGGPPVVAWPMDGNLIRKGSRLNKVLLLRLDPATLVGITQERAADGVVPIRRSAHMRDARWTRGSTIKDSRVLLSLLAL
jgi:hypothetical protein